MSTNKNYFTEPLDNVENDDKPGIIIGQKISPMGKCAQYLRQGFYGIKNVKNWQEILPKLVRNNCGATVEFRDGSRYSIPQARLRRIFSLLLELKEHDVEMEISPDFDRIEFGYLKRRVVLEGPDAIGLAYDAFFLKEYAPLEVDNKLVVDIGANVGDTAIYFALSGAKNIVAFEPYLYSFSLAKKNMRRNRLEGRITLINAAVGEKDSIMRLSTGEETFGGSQMSASGKGRWIEVLSLETLVKRYVPDEKGKAVLKIDCEGYEYDILLSAPKRTIRRFEEIMLEFHYGQVNIRKKLEECGFEVSIIKPPRYYYCNLWKMPHGRIGLLHAKRIDDVKE